MGQRYYNIAAVDREEGLFYVNELIMVFVDSREYIVVERQDIDTVLAEQRFQLSGNVDDDTAVSIGKLLGANVVITGNINGSGSRKRLVLKALDVRTGQVLAMSSGAV